MGRRKGDSALDCVLISGEEANNLFLLFYPFEWWLPGGRNEPVGGGGIGPPWGRKIANFLHLVTLISPTIEGSLSNPTGILSYVRHYI